jgi:hypothetical protein
VERRVGPAYAGVVQRYADLDYPGLAKLLSLKRAPQSAPSFDPTRIAYYDRIRSELQLTAEEEAIYRRTGMVGVDHGQRYSMGSAYFGIYGRDLPVLVTTDSILHAMHRSFDNMLMEVEVQHLRPRLISVLEAAHAALKTQAAGISDSSMRASLSDVDLYLTVARNLLSGAGAPPGGLPAERCNRFFDPRCGDTWDGELSVPSSLGDDAAALEALKNVASLRPSKKVRLYGGSRFVDFSQFLPRGHYTKNVVLRRYFRTMMWLGRVDLGFQLSPPDPLTGIDADVPREQRNAALLGWLVASSQKLDSLSNMSHVVDFLVGSSDNVTVADVAHAVERAGIKQISDLALSSTLTKFEAALKNVPGQQIRSQIVFSDRSGTRQTALPDVFQMFGQRFVIDSFVLSKVVFDSILYRGEKQLRMMPTGLDVMSALGNDEAVSLLAPEIERHHYAANLLAARAVVEQLSPSTWDDTLYNVWLSALSKLDDVPAEPRFPSVMRSQAWQHKQLQTQLASWAELRHDTILYAKQSYTAVPICEYPTGYVEPYPDFFARLAFFADEAKRRLSKALSIPPPMAEYLDRFSSVSHKLETLAKKELEGRAFDSDERGFIKKTIDIRGGGSGPPKYDGWYPGIIYGGSPASWEPTVADVHTDPDGGNVLEVAVGDVAFLVIAVDNETDRAAYVGPIYSYYEFSSNERLTDEAWQTKINDGKLPPRPEWTKSFQATVKTRQLGAVRR